MTALALVCILAGASGCGSGIAPGLTSQNTSAPPVASALGPQLGYLWLTTDHTLRAILGIPGASQVGQSVVPAGVYVGAATSASASIAILQATDGSFDLMSLPTGSAVSLGLTLPAGARMQLSPSAASALLYSPGASSASLITGIPSAPAVHTVATPGPISDSAVSDAGSIALEYTQGSSVAVAVATLNGRPTTVATIGSGGGLTFLPGHDDLLLADSVRNSLTLVRSAGTAPSAQTIASNGLLHSPSAVGISNSGRWALVANGGSQSLMRVDLNTLAAVAVSCNCKPTLSESLADDGAFRVTSLASGPNWIVDAAASTPRSLFIPALPASTPANTAMIASAGRP